ncbi:PadR family transcriptional regulator [Streptomyces sp. NPDC013455]|uniref:PadR family transcriptional regulator n=1 Tax=Streptomyces sp. NPDC013455 TaxID=3155605 RepID=UPI0033D0F995
MLELSILGFLAEEALHGYELKERITALSGLSGHVRPVSDGALYPAINRLLAAGLLDQRSGQGPSAAPRRVLVLTEEGRAELLRRLRGPRQAEITDPVRFHTVLAFLRHLDDPAEQAAVLRRRLDFLAAPAGSSRRAGGPGRAPEAGDLFREGLLRVARAAGDAEREWLREAIATLSRARS